MYLKVKKLSKQKEMSIYINELATEGSNEESSRMGDSRPVGKGEIVGGLRPR